MRRDHKSESSRQARRFNRWMWGLGLFVGFVPLDGTAALPVAELKREAPVDFQSEILPIFNANCLACHNQTKSKAGLILETPQSILEGGDSGPSVVVGKPEESILFQAAAHLDEDLVMPPVGNKSNAKDLSPQELALLSEWIREGATGEVSGDASLDWQPLSQRVQPVYAMAMSREGRYVAYGRGSQAALYELPSRVHSGRLIDPALEGGQTHLDTVNAIAVHPGGRLIATGGFREVKLWEKVVRKDTLDLIDSHHARPVAVDVARTGSVMAALYASGEIRRWHLSTGQELAGARIEAELGRAIRVAPDGDRILVLGEGRTFTMVRFLEGDVQHEQSEVRRPVQASVWAPSGDRFALALANGSVMVWSFLSSGDLEPNVVGEYAGVLSLGFGRESQRELLLGFQSEGVRIVDFANGDVLREWELDSAVHHVSLNDAATLALLGTGDGHAALWDYDAGKQRTTLQGARPQQLALVAQQRALQFRKSDRELTEKEAEAIVEELKKEQERVAKAETDQTEKQKAVEEAKGQLTAAKEAHEKAEQALMALDAKVSSAETALAEARKASEQAGEDAKALVGQLRAAQQVEGATPESVDAINAQVDEALKKVAELAFATGEAKALLERVKGEVAGEKKSAQDAVNAAQKTLEGEEKKQADVQRALGIAENELKLATKSVARLQQRQESAVESVTSAKEAVVSAEGQLADGKKALDAALIPFYSVDFSPTGDRVIAVGADGSVTSWWAETGEALDYVPGDSVTLIAGHPLTDRTALVVGSEHGATVVHFDSAWQLRETLGPEQGFADRVNALDFSADGSYLAAGGGDPSRTGEVKVWRLDSLDQVHNLDQVHSDVVFGLRFSPDGQYLATASADRFARVVNLETAETVHSFEGHTHYVMDVSWQANGRSLVSAGADGMAKVWDVTTGERKQNIEGFKKEVTGVGFVGEGEEVVASSGDATVAIYGLDGKKRRSMEDSQTFVFAESVSGDGRFVAAGSQDGTLTVWDLPSGKVLTRVR